MAFSDGGALGSAQSKTSGTTVVITTTAVAEVGKIIAVATAWDTISATGDATNLSVTDSAGNTYTRRKEYSYAPSGSNSAAQVAIFETVVSTELPSGGTITVTSDTARTAKMAIARKFSKGAGTTIAFEQAAHATGDAADPGTISLSGMTSREYLELWFCGVENASVTFTQGTNFNDAGSDGTTGGGSASNIWGGFGFRIATLTSESIDPATDPDGDHAQILIALYEEGGGGPTTITAAGAIASAESFGTPHVRRINQPTGIASAESVGQPRLTRILQPIAIASAESVAVPNLIRWVRQAGGISSGESFGQPTVGVTLIFSAGGIPSAESFGEPRLTRILQPIAVASAEAFGTPNLLRLIHNAGGIASQESHGVARVLRVLQPTGIASAEVVSGPKVVRLIYPVSLASLEAFGVTTVSELVPGTEGAFGQVLVSDALRYGLLVADDEVYLVEVSDAERFGTIVSDRPGG